ncbi:MAG TPA: hypothetical protein EYP46_00300 [Hadesarchaea archaeon]|nr:hypothetical protein [Hadesarchaea archaeon]
MEPVKKPALSVERLTIFFAAAGAVAGLISGVMTGSDIKLNVYSLLVAIILFYISYKLTACPKIKAKFLVTMVEEPRAVKKPNVAMTGFFPYFILWLIVWVLVYTVLITSG